MADFADGIDITTDLNGQSADSQPYHQGDVPQNGQPVPAPPPSTQIPDAAKEDSGDKPASLRDLLTDAFKGGETAPPAVKPPVPQGQQEAVVPPADAAPALVKVGDRWHNPDGTFASQEQINAFQAGQASAPAQGEVPAWATQQLTPLELQQFTALPAETRQFVERTMEAVNQRGAALAEYEQLESILGPRRAAWGQNGLTPLVALNNLFSLSDFAGRDPAQFVLWFADQHRLDMDAILDERDANQAPQDPHLQGLQNQVAQLTNTINGFTQQTVQQQQAANLQLVQSFMAEKDEAGSPLYPHFNTLSSEIARHVSIIRAQQPYLSERDTLKAAYDFAAYNNPTIRAEVQQAQVEKARKAAEQEAAKARQASGSINGGPAGDTSGQQQNANRTLREELEYQYAQSTLN